MNAILRKAALALLLACGAGAASAGPSTYHVSVDTQALSGQGWLDFLLLGLGNAAPVTATLSHFTGNFTTPALVYANGNAGGSAKTGATLGNGGAFNEFALWANFGGTFGFDVDFAVDASNPLLGAGTSFSVALLNGAFGYAGGTAGDIVTIALQPGLDDVASTDPAFARFGAASVPEAPTGWLVAGGLFAGLLARRHKRLS